jgi:hypothetical protein
MARRVMTEAPAAKAVDRPTFRLVLRPEPGVDATRALRSLIKIALRTFRLKCISVEEMPP